MTYQKHPRFSLFLASLCFQHDVMAFIFEVHSCRFSCVAKETRNLRGRWVSKNVSGGTNSNSQQWHLLPYQKLWKCLIENVSCFRSNILLFRHAPNLSSLLRLPCSTRKLTYLLIGVSDLKSAVPSYHVRIEKAPVIQNWNRAFLWNKNTVFTKHFIFSFIRIGLNFHLLEIPNCSEDI